LSVKDLNRNKSATNPQQGRNILGGPVVLELKNAILSGNSRNSKKRAAREFRATIMLAANAGTFPVCGFLTARPHPVHFVHPV